MRVTRHEEFEVAHLLPGYNGGCGNLHGHTYKIEVTVEGPKNPDYFNMVIDFSELKQIIKNNVPDHRFVYRIGDPIGESIAELLSKHNIKHIGYSFETTAENMVEWFAHTINSDLQTGRFGNVEVVEVKLWETTNSYATWRKQDEK